MFQDEARFGRITNPRRCWAPYPLQPVCKTILTREYLYAYAAARVSDGVLDTLILPSTNTECMQIFLDEVASRHPDDRIVMVLDGTGWHRSQMLKMPENMRLLKLPPYSPELNPVENPVENLWDDLREKSFGNIVFDSLDAVELHLEIALRNFELQQDRVKSIITWPYKVLIKNGIKHPAASYGVLTALYKLLAVRQPTPQGAENRARRD